MNREQMIEVMARGRWERHYPAGPGSLAEKVVVPWAKASGQSRREYLADAAADLAALEAAGAVMVPREPTEAMVQAMCAAIEDTENTTSYRDDDPVPYWGAWWTAEAQAAYTAMLAASPMQDGRGV